MMRVVTALAVLVSLGVRATPTGALRQGSPCRPVDAFTTGLRDFLVQLDTSADSSNVEQRTAFSLPVVPATEVVVVADSLVCAQAAAAYYRRLKNPPADQAVAVVRVGSMYVVGDPRVTVGEFTAYAIFDSTFSVNVSNFAG